MNFFTEVLFLNFIYLSCIFLFIIYLFKKNFFYLNFISNKKFAQTIHHGKVPRIGGTIIFFYIILNQLLHEDSGLFLPALTLIPIVLLSTVEDIYHNISPKIRLYSMFLSSFLLLFFCINQFPAIDFFDTLNFLLQYDILKYFFFSTCLVTLMNGYNLIDGVNGNFSSSLISSFLCLAYLSYLFNYQDILYNLLFIVSLCSSFFLVNYPFGKIFMGDTGPYFLGGLIGYFAIDLFGRSHEINSWCLIIIFFYPIAELFYSFVRKIYTKKSPFESDDCHLHIKLFKIFSKGLIGRTLVANNMVVVFLSIFILYPILTIPYIYKSTLLIFIAFFIILILYVLLNLSINKLQVSKDEKNK